MKKIQLTAIFVFAVIVLAFQAQAATPYSQVVSNDAPVLYGNFDEPSGNAHEVIPLIPPTNINNLNPEGVATRVSHAAIGDGFNLGNAGSFSLGVSGSGFFGQRPHRRDQHPCRTVDAGILDASARQSRISAQQLSDEFRQ